MDAKQPNNTTHSARMSALYALTHTLDKKRPLDEYWATDRQFASLNPSDRAFAQLLAKTVLRHLGEIDALLAHFVERAPAPRAVQLLRLGAAQLLWLDTPAHAAVHSTVETAKQAKLAAFSGLINAVLKKIAQEGKALAASQDAALLNTPAWLWQSWVDAYGKNTAQAIAEAHMREPQVDVSVKSGAELWAQKLGGTLLPTGSIRLAEARSITQLPGFAEGAWWVQDAAAALPALLLAGMKGRRVVDLCAAPGGKTAQLAALGAQVTAVEKSRTRMPTLKANLKRLKLEVDCITADALTWKPDFTPDAILLDAPCSATGTLRRHPDVAWHRQPADIARLTATQQALLNHALDMLAPGGRLVYAVCSLQPEEGEMQISRLLAERKDVSLSPIAPEAVGGLAECLTKRGELRSLPCHMAEHGGMDGFYAAVLIKRNP